MKIIRPEQFEDLVRTAKHSPDFPGIVSRIIGRELYKQRYRTKNGAIVFKTRLSRDPGSDYSALTLFYNQDTGWQVLDHKGRINGDAIAVVQKEYGYTYDNAVYFLAGFDPGRRAVRKDFQKERDAIRKFSAPESSAHRAFTPFAFSTRREDTVRLRAYLGKTRGIPYPLIDQLLKEGLIGEAAHNPYGRRPACVVFNCKNKEGKICGQFWRSTLSPEYVTEQNAPYQKGNVAGSDGAVPWVFTYAPDESEATLTVICEAPIDAISFCAMAGQPANYVAMGGLIASSVEGIKERFGDNILLCVDNDPAGRAFIEKWISKHPEDKDKVMLPDAREVLEHDRVPGKEKADWNQNLKYRLEKDLYVALKEPAKSEALSCGMTV